VIRVLVALLAAIARVGAAPVPPQEPTLAVVEPAPSAR
jgi:hypothetical protein